MPRRPRLTIADVPLHLIQRGNGLAKAIADKAGYRNHANVLITNHVHLRLSASRREAPGELIKAFGQKHAQYFNRTYWHSGRISLVKLTGSCKR